MMARGELPMDYGKEPCLICKTKGIYRFSDVMAEAYLPEGKEVREVPLCKWCAAEVTRNKPAEVFSKKQQVFKPRPCKHCGEMFTPQGPRAQYAPGHRKTGKPRNAGIRKVKRPIGIAVPILEGKGAEAMVTVNIPVAALDRIWNSRTPEEKARAFEVMVSRL
jgi:hypothetical protein